MHGRLLHVLSRCEVGDCWTFIGALSNGYGRITVDTVGRYVHRWVWEQLVGPIEAGLVIDHLCRNRACCNPDHLRVTDDRVNIRAGQAGHWQTLKTACPKGHAYTPQNTRFHSKTGARVCHTCRMDAQRRRREQSS